MIIVRYCTHLPEQGAELHAFWKLRLEPAVSQVLEVTSFIVHKGGGLVDTPSTNPPHYAQGTVKLFHYGYRTVTHRGRRIGGIGCPDLIVIDNSVVVALVPNLHAQFVDSAGAFLLAINQGDHKPKIT